METATTGFFMETICLWVITAIITLIIMIITCNNYNKNSKYGKISKSHLVKLSKNLWTIENMHFQIRTQNKGNVYQLILLGNNQ